MAEPKEVPMYTSMYINSDGDLEKKTFIANDHEDVIKQIQTNEGEKAEIFAVWIGDIPDPIWFG